MPQFNYKDLVVEIEHKRSLKHSYIKITPHAKIILKTPINKPAFFEKLFEEKEGWIRNKLYELEQNPPRFLEESKEHKHHAKTYLPQRLEHFAQIMNLEYEGVRIRSMRSRWGSCSAKRTITLNSKLIQLEQEMQDYVIIHELAHLVHMNHSKAFHSLVQSYMPNAKEIRKRLKTVRLA